MAVKQGYGTAAPTNVQIIAPSTLNAGYTFDAMYDGVTFTVTVPEGGVVKGQRFIVPFAPPAEPVAVGVPVGNRSNRGEIPIGVWRDSLWNCCGYGPFHPHFLLSWFCRSILVGQLLTRMKMTWLGQRESGSERNMNDSRAQIQEAWRNTFRNLVVLTVVFFVLMGVTSTPQTLDPTMSAFDESKSNEPQFITYEQLSDIDKVKYTRNGWISAFFSVYVIYIIAKLRATMRQTYSIPEESCLCCYQLGVFGNNPRQGIECCGTPVGSVDGSSTPIGWEDVCCSIWCQLCVTAQMARHTVDYTEKKGVCCNSVGVYDWDEDEAYVGLEGGVGEGSVLVV